MRNKTRRDSNTLLFFIESLRKRVHHIDEMLHITILFHFHLLSCVLITKLNVSEPSSFKFKRW